ncbi:MAG: hypothetical protein NW241_23195 [Bacteroidia bacterium]|nr:hypothetical protein [Bacteroidia bacterium]
MMSECFRTMLLAAGLAAGCCLYGQQMYPVRLTNTGELYSTPRLRSNAEAVAALRDHLGPARTEVILSRIEEDSWPEGIATLDARNTSRPLLQDYHAWLLLKLPDGYSAILMLPAAENRHMPESLQLTGDIFWNIGLSGFSLIPGGAGVPVPALADSPQAAALRTDAVPGTFESQLNAIVAAFPDRFSSLKGDTIPQTGGFVSLSQEWESRIQVEGSKQTYISRSRLGGRQVVVADFGQTYDAAEAERWYRQLAERVNQVSFDCCGMVYDESVSDYLSVTYWLPFQIPDPRYAAMERLLVEVQLSRVPVIVEREKGEYQYSVVLRAGEQPD